MYGEKDRPLVSIALLASAAIAAVFAVALFAVDRHQRAHFNHALTIVTTAAGTTRGKPAPASGLSHEPGAASDTKLAPQSPISATLKKEKPDAMALFVMVPDLPRGTTARESAGVWSDQGSAAPVSIGNGATNGSGPIAMALVGGRSLPLTSPTGSSPNASSANPGAVGGGMHAPVIPGGGSGSIGQPNASQSHLGFVLVAGGQGGGKFALSSAQLYDPATAAFVASPPMRVARTDHTATVLPSGKIFVAGGDDAVGNALSSAELYDPASGRFSLVASKMNTARAEHSATLISGCSCPADGQVLIAGGVGDRQGGPPLGSAELYDPATGKFTATGSMKVARAMHTATLLASGPLAGNVLIAGGIDASRGELASAELYDPVNGQFTSTGTMSVPRQGHSATWLAPGIISGALAGKVLIAGGGDIHAPSNSAEVFSPQTGSFAPVGSMSTPRILQAAVLLGNGEVLVAGGQNSETEFLITAELFNPATASFSPTAKMINLHVGASATMLENGSVLVAGGRSSLADLYDPAAGTFSATGKMVTDLAESTATLIR